jgi:ATP-binding cassette, subfamily A (ABC1), member 3
MVIFVHQLKGCQPLRIGYEVYKMLNVLYLDEKRNVEARNLSGGMKRKLCVGIALIGDSKVGLHEQYMSIATCFPLR